jgi:hypothetical protein
MMSQGRHVTAGLSRSSMGSLWAMWLIPPCERSAPGVSEASEAARDADRYARAGEWAMADLACARALRSLPANEASARAELLYSHAEILRQLARLPDALTAARDSQALYQELVVADPIRAADRARDAASRAALLALMAEAKGVPEQDRVPLARRRAGTEPGTHRELELARQLSLSRSHLAEAAAIYRRLRPLGADDLDLFADAALVAAEALFDVGHFDDAAAYAADAATALGALSVRRPERYEKRWYDARELAARSRELAG